MGEKLGGLGPAREGEWSYIIISMSSCRGIDS